MTPRPGPAERVARRLGSHLAPEEVALLPRGYQRLGRVLVLRLPERLRPHFPAIGAAWQEELGVATVLRHAGATDGAWRRPRIETIAGASGVTEVLENGIRFRFDAASIMFAAGNRTERLRVAREVRPGERVLDLFSGIGYFVLLIAVHARPASVVAVEANPTAFRYLVENVALNRVATTVRPVLGDNRRVELPLGAADRVHLGYLPSSEPWVRRAVELAAPGATLHVHRVSESRQPLEHVATEVEQAVQAAGGDPVAARPRTVKPYGPGRRHDVVDVRLGGAPTG